MNEAEGAGMQRLPVESGDQLAQPGVGDVVETPAVGVERISYNRKPRFTHMYTNLVCPACFQAQFHQGNPAVAPAHPPSGDGGLPMTCLARLAQTLGGMPPDNPFQLA